MVETLIDTYPTNLAVYRIHISDPFELPTQWDEQRWNFYRFGDGYIPRFVVDGLHDMTDDCDEGPNNPCDSSLYESRINARQPMTTDVTISLSGYEVDVQTYDIVALLCIEPGGVDKEMRLHVVDLLDNWPPAQNYYRNTLRQAADSLDIELTAGNCVNVWTTFAFDDTDWAQQSDIKIMAWLQTPAAAFPAEVHQAAQMAWPFPVVDSDGDGFLDDVDNCPRDYNPLQIDSDGDTFGDECDICPGFDDRLDEDGDGVPDGCDLCWGDDATGDSDGDGVCDDLDQCWGDDATGDADGDGVCDDLDLCWGDDATGDGDGDLFCADVDCDDGDPDAWEYDNCGVCGGDDSSCLIFEDDFETGGLGQWHLVVGSQP